MLLATTSMKRYVKVSIAALTSLQAYQNVASTTAAHLIEAASNLQNTDFAEETARITKQSLIKNYALAMVATANAEEMEKLKLLA